MALAKLSNAPSVLQKFTTTKTEAAPDEAVTVTLQAHFLVTLKDKTHWQGLDPIFPDCWSLSQLVASRKEEDPDGKSRGLLITAQSKMVEFNLHLFHGDKPTAFMSLGECDLKGKPKLHISRGGEGAVFLAVKVKLLDGLVLELLRHVGADIRISLDFRQLQLPGTATVSDITTAAVKHRKSKAKTDAEAGAEGA